MKFDRDRREVIVETRNLSMHFGGVRAVEQVDFTLFDKELRCLIGPNGAGKSTFFKCLTGQLRPTSGEVLIRSQETTGAEPHEIASLGVGIKTQVPNVFDGLSVDENIWMKVRARRTKTFIQISGATYLASPPPHDLKQQHKPKV